MTVPTSLALGALVVGWLIVLVPMASKTRQAVPRSSDGTGRFRVLKRKSGEGRRLRWGRHDESDFADLEPEDWQDDETDLQQQILETDDEYVDPYADDLDADYDDDLDGEYTDDLDGEYADEYTDEFEAPEQSAPARISPLRAAADPDVDEFDQERYRPVPVRAGRGGYDPAQDDRARAYRYRRRRTVALVLLLATVLSAVTAQFLWTPAWSFTAVAGSLLVLYFVYLRRQVKIEADIRARRLARLRRARQIRPEYREHSRSTPDSIYDSRRQIVDLDDDDPAFDDLETYHAPVTYRRAAGE